MWRTSPRSTAGGARLAGAALAVITMVTGAIAVSAAPASAVAAPFTVNNQSASNSTSPKTIVASCPSGTRLYGVSPYLVNGLGDVTLDDVRPDAGLTSATVAAYENGSTGQAWAVGVDAICGSPTANLQRVAVTSASNSSSPKTVSATCPSGTRLYGLGAELTGAVGNVFFDDMRPSTGLTSVTIAAYENGSYGSTWNVTAYAICANPAATMTMVSSTGPTDSQSPKDERVTCPSGTHLHGVGGELTGAVGNVTMEDLQVTAALVGNDVKAYENGAYGSSWRITAYGICSS